MKPLCALNFTVVLPYAHNYVDRITEFLLCTPSTNKLFQCIVWKVYNQKKKSVRMFNSFHGTLRLVSGGNLKLKSRQAYEINLWIGNASQ